MFVVCCPDVEGFCLFLVFIGDACCVCVFFFVREVQLSGGSGLLMLSLVCVNVLLRLQASVLFYVLLLYFA